MELTKTEREQDDGRRAVDQFNKLERRFGQFSISMDMIGNPDYEKELTMLFSKVVVLRADDCIFRGVIRYLAWSRDFKKMEDNTIEIPMYYIVYTKHDDGSLTMELDEVVGRDDPRFNDRLTRAFRQLV
jgi:hypothetical protein